MANKIKFKINLWSFGFRNKRFEVLKWVGSLLSGLYIIFSLAGCLEPTYDALPPINVNTNSSLEDQRRYQVDFEKYHQFDLDNAGGKYLEPPGQVNKFEDDIYSLGNTNSPQKPSISGDQVLPPNNNPGMRFPTPGYRGVGPRDIRPPRIQSEQARIRSQLPGRPFSGVVQSARDSQPSELPESSTQGTNLEATVVTNPQSFDLSDMIRAFRYCFDVHIDQFFLTGKTRVGLS